MSEQGQNVTHEGRRPARLCGAPLDPRHPHVCALFRSIEEQNHVLLPFTADGLAAGEKVVHTLDPDHIEERIGHFAAAGIDFPAARDAGRIELRPWTETHLTAAGFDAQRTLALYRQIAGRSIERGFPITRFVTHMEWAASGSTAATDLVAYEAKANEVWLGGASADPVICVYDLNRFSGELIVDIVRAHPLTLIGGVLQENPYYVPPDRFLRERRAPGAPTTLR